MKRRVMFDGSEASVRRFEYLYEGFCVGGTILANQAKGQADFDGAGRRGAKLARKLKAISAQDDGKQYPNGAPARALLGGDLLLEQAELELLERHVKVMPWRADLLDEVEDAVDFLSAAERIED
jgi:hypothetical protein